MNKSHYHNLYIFSSDIITEEGTMTLINMPKILKKNGSTFEGQNSSSFLCVMVHLGATQINLRFGYFPFHISLYILAHFHHITSCIQTFNKYCLVLIHSKTLLEITVWFEDMQTSVETFIVVSKGIIE